MWWETERQRRQSLTSGGLALALLGIAVPKLWSLDRSSENLGVSVEHILFANGIINVLCLAYVCLVFNSVFNTVITIQVIYYSLKKRLR